MSDEPPLTVADMLEIWANGGYGFEYVDGMSLVETAVANLRAQAEEITRLRSDLTAALTREITLRQRIDKIMGHACEIVRHCKAGATPISNENEK